MQRDGGEALSALKEELAQLPPAENQEQQQALEALNKLAQTLDKLEKTAESMRAPQSTTNPTDI